MPGLDFILPPTATVARSNGKGELATEKPRAGADEPFVNLMARVLSPDSSPAGAPVKQNQQSVSPGKYSPAPAQTIAVGVSTTVSAKTIGRLFPAKSTNTRIALSGKSNAKTDKDDCPHPLANSKTDAVTVGSQGTVAQCIMPIPVNAIPLPAPPLTGKTGLNGGTIPVTATLHAKADTAHSVPAVEAAAAPAKAAASASVANGSDATAPQGKVDSQPPSDFKPGEAPKITGPVKAPTTAKDASGEINVGNSKAADRPLSSVPENRGMTPAVIFQEPAPRLLKPEDPVQPWDRAKAPPNADGTSVAKLDIAMKKTEKTNEIAGSAEKILPGNAVLTASKNNLPVRSPAALALPHGNPSELIVNAGPAAADSTPVATTPAATDLHARAADRTHDIVSLQAARLQDSGSDSLRVVIKPGAGTQLSLELRQHGDRIEAQAVLQRGDFNHLNQHWPELQQRLEQRGIKLAPLAGLENAASNGGRNGFQQPQQQSAKPEPPLAGAIAGFPPVSSPIQSVAPASTAAAMHRGWETWA